MAAPGTRDSERHPGIPQGKVTKYEWTSKIYLGTVRDYWVYVPAQYKPEKPARTMVFQDGASFVSEAGPRVTCRWSSRSSSTRGSSCLPARRRQAAMTATMSMMRSATGIHDSQAIQPLDRSGDCRDKLGRQLLCQCGVDRGPERLQ